MTVSHVLDTYYKKDSVNESALKFLLLIQKLRLIQVTGNFSGISHFLSFRIIFAITISFKRDI